jgi:hypothetical protein
MCMNNVCIDHYEWKKLSSSSSSSSLHTSSSSSSSLNFPDYPGPPTHGRPPPLIDAFSIQQQQRRKTQINERYELVITYTHIRFLHALTHFPRSELFCRLRQNR